MVTLENMIQFLKQPYICLDLRVFNLNKSEVIQHEFYKKFIYFLYNVFIDF